MEEHTCYCQADGCCCGDFEIETDEESEAELSQGEENTQNLFLDFGKGFLHPLLL